MIVSKNPNWGTGHQNRVGLSEPKAMVYPSGEAITYTDVYTGREVTVEDYKLLKITYSSAFTRTQENKKTRSEKGKTSQRQKRTWFLDYEVLVRRGMVHASQGRISENNEVNLVLITFAQHSLYFFDRAMFHHRV